LLFDVCSDTPRLHNGDWLVVLSYFSEVMRAKDFIKRYASPMPDAMACNLLKMSALRKYASRENL